jgi:hypothetical protein
MADEGIHNTLDVLQELARAARHRFDSRREYEWKICFALWTALATFSGFVLN